MRHVPFIFLALLAALLGCGASVANAISELTSGQQICTFENNSSLMGGNDTTKVGYYYHQDSLDSSSALSSSSGSQQEYSVFYPFGRVQASSSVAGTFAISRQFTGQVRDDETGLYYYGGVGSYGRYYDVLIDRFVQADDLIPDLSDPQSYNRYTYCINNPLRYTDLSGHDYLGVGGMFEGYYDAGAGVVRGTAFMVVRPIATAEGVGTAIAHPINTSKAIARGVAADWNSGARGQDRVVGGALLTIASVLAPGAEAGDLSKVNTVANVGEKIEPTAVTSEATEETTTVGRWMGQSEYDAMQSSGTVQAPLNGAGATHVTVPPNPAAFTPQPSSGSVFVQFDVPNSQLRISDPSQGWGRVFGPDSIEARLAARQGLPVPTKMPPAFNIQQTASQ